MKLSLIELRYSEREAGLETYKEYRILEILDNKRNWRKSNKKINVEDVFRWHWCTFVACAGGNERYIPSLFVQHLLSVSFKTACNPFH